MGLLTYLPRRSVYDPPESSEGSLDPLGLALLGGRLAERLVPGMTERTRRPRFLTALAVGAAVLQRNGEGVYRDTPQGQAQIAWERLLGEAYAWKGAASDRGLLGIPGIQKARTARDADVRLLSHLYLKSPGAVGLWVAYKGLAEATHVLDESGNLLEAGFELLDAWERGIGEKGLLTGLGGGGSDLADKLDEALRPLFGERSSQWKPQQVWTLIHEHLHPSRMTEPEMHVLSRLLRDSNPGRGSMFAHVEERWRKSTDLLDLPERQILERIPVARAALHECAQTVMRYEALAGQLTAAFECILRAGADFGDGRVDAKRVLSVEGVGATFAGSPARIEAAVDAARTSVETAVDPELARTTLDWVDADLVASPEGLFEGLLLRHRATQLRKPPAGKLPWVEGSSGAWFVRVAYMQKAAPPARGHDWVHPYRTYSVRSCL